MDPSIPLPKFDYGDPVAHWLVTEAFRLTDTRELVKGIAEKLVEVGIPLFRLAYFRRSLHPELLGTAYYWQRGKPITTQDAPHTIVGGPDYLASPLLIVYRDGKTIRVRLEHEDTAFAVLKTLKAEGATDYILMPVVHATGHLDALSVATDAPGGFAKAALERMYALQLLFARIVEIHALRQTATDLLDAYVGRAAGARILSGAVKRGDGETIRAVIWFSDLRGFTAMSDRLPREALLDLLNDYFDALGGVIARHGGEILKFVGDAVLAIFPVQSGKDAAACQAAIKAAITAREAVAKTNETRESSGKPAIAFGLALHIGDVLYGNIGTKSRLDFTVIGPAVNHASRIEALAKPLGEPLIMSAEFAAHVPEAARSLGRHALAGIEGEREVFGLRC